MQNFKLELLPLPTEALKLIKEKFTGYLAIHRAVNSSYIWFDRGDFIGAYPEGFDLLDRLVQLEVFSQGKAKTIKASKKKGETIAALLTRLDLKLEDCDVKQVLTAVFEEQLALAAEVFTYTSGSASIFETEAETLPQDNLTDLTMPGLQFFLEVMRTGEKKLASSYKDLAPSSIFSLKKLNSEAAELVLPFLDEKERTVYTLADGSRTIKEIAEKCNVRSQKIKYIYIRLHLLKLLDTGVSPDLKDKLMSTVGYRNSSNELQIDKNSRGVWWGAGALCFLLLFLNLAGMFQGLELSFFDRFTRWKKLKYEPIDDITLITFDDVDIKNMGQWPLSDESLVRVLENVAQHQPTTIGLDIYRDVPVEPGSSRLNRFYRDYDKLVSIKKIVPPAIDSSPILEAKGDVAASDLVADSDGTIRKFLVNVWSGEDSYNSLGLETALRHLKQTGESANIIYPNNAASGTLGTAAPGDSETIALKPLTWSFSGYRWSDLAGVQVLGNFLYDLKDFNTISLYDAYRGEFDPKLVKGKIVMIGSTADSLKDYFNTPLSHRIWGSQPMPGVVIHANVASSYILGGRGKLVPLKPLSLPTEFGLFILAYLAGSVAGVAVLWHSFEELPLPGWVVNGAAYLGGIFILVGTGFALFVGGLWIPTFSLGVFYTGGLLYSGTFQNNTKRWLYTNRATGIKNRKYLLRYLDSKPKGIEDYSLIGLYLGFDQLNFNSKEKADILKKVARTLTRHLQVKSEIAQVSNSCLVLVLDFASSDKIQLACDRLDKILMELNIGDSQNRLKYQIVSQSSIHLPNAEPEAVLDSVLRALH